MTAVDAWDEERDVVVIGSGGAGLTGATVAALGGSRVTVLEKAAVVGGTTAYSGGGVWIPMNRHMAAVGVEDSREEALKYLRAISPRADDDMIVALVDTGVEMLEFLEEHANLSVRPYPSTGTTADYYEKPGAKRGGRPLSPGPFRYAELGDWADRVRRGPSSMWVGDKLNFFNWRPYIKDSAPAKEAAAESGLTSTELSQATMGVVAGGKTVESEFFGNGTSLIGQLLKVCLEHGVDVHTSARARELIVEDGRVAGVRYVHDGVERTIRALRGVLVASGGFVHNEQLKKQFLPRPITASCGAESNEGDGLLMGIAAGADVSNLGDAWWTPMVEVGRPGGGPYQFVMMRQERAAPHSIMVNGRGRRFTNEAMNYYNVGASFGSFTDPHLNLPAYMVFDSQFMEKYELLSRAGTPDGGQPDYLVTAPTLPELAAQIGIDANGLVATVERFNEYARAGVDPDFHRGEAAWDREWGDPANQPNPSLGAIEVGPYFAVQLLCGAFDTKGGLHINSLAEVLSAREPGRTIPGLYAAGNCSSGALPDVYAGLGGTLGPGMTFAYLAGRQLSAAGDVVKSPGGEVAQVG